jgi:hypothetical protein
VRSSLLHLSQRGLTWTLQGLRTADSRLLLTGAALLLYRWYRNQTRARRLAYVTHLADGDRVTIGYRTQDRRPAPDV